MVFEIRDFSKEYLNDLKRLFSGLQNFEKNIFPERAEPTVEYVNEIISSMFDDVKKKKGKILLAFKDGMPVGYTFGFVQRDVENDIDYFFVDALYVDEKHRGLGIGTKLLKEVENYAKSLKLSKIQIGVLAGNVRAYDLYKKLGFKDYGIEMLKDL